VSEKSSPSPPLEERAGERRPSELVPEIENQNSKIENAEQASPSHPLEERRPSELVSKIRHCHHE